MKRNGGNSTGGEIDAIHFMARHEDNSQVDFSAKEVRYWVSRYDAS